ncbi:MAG: glutamate 5-kinase [Candidatus Melainabacteria bacterium]|nr:glutamate 5-kinase [Candidatus Melainabacteria bacterium]
MAKGVIILKIGTSSITKEKPACATNLQGKPIVNVGINYQVLNELAQVAAHLRQQGYQVIIVSSGAMGLGVTKLGAENLKDKLEATCDSPDLVSFKQALTSVGQVDLINAYETVFSNYGTHVGQVLVTHKGLDDTERNETIHRTLEKLFALDIVPIINANDAVTSAELEYGDNDSLSARVAVLIKAQRLFVISEADGLYDDDPRLNPEAKIIPVVKNIDEVRGFAHESTSTAGLGGMKSKVEAAEICVQNGVAVDIIGVDKISQISDYVNGGVKQPLGTQFEI